MGGADHHAQEPVTVTTSGLCTWWTVSSVSAGPSSRRQRSRFSATASRRSPEPKPQLREAKMPSLTPPVRGKKP
jgi:hypothetical protein